MKKVIHWDDLGYSAQIETFKHYMYFRIAAITATDIFHLKTGEKCHRSWRDAQEEEVYDITKSTPYMSGHIKWDGCSNIQFDEQNNAMLHFCGKTDATNIGVLIARLYDLASKSIPNADKDLFK